MYSLSSGFLQLYFSGVLTLVLPPQGQNQVRRKIYCDGDKWKRSGVLTLRSDVFEYKPRIFKGLVIHVDFNRHMYTYVVTPFSITGGCTDDTLNFFYCIYSFVGRVSSLRHTDPVCVHTSLPVSSLGSRQKGCVGVHIRVLQDIESDLIFYLKSRSFHQDGPEETQTHLSKKIFEIPGNVSY